MNTRTKHRPNLRTTLDVCTTVHSNTTFMANRGDEFEGEPKARKHAMAKARAAGVNPTGKRFFGGLCPPGEPFSPKAWVTESNAKAEIKAKCAAHGLHCEGLVKSDDNFEPPDELGTPDTLGLAD